MKKIIVRCATVMGFVGTALSLIWIGFSNAPAPIATEANLNPAKKSAARERADWQLAVAQRRTLSKTSPRPNFPAQHRSCLQPARGNSWQG